jgi:hypothetical protein
MMLAYYKTISSQESNSDSDPIWMDSTYVCYIFGIHCWFCLCDWQTDRQTLVSYSTLTPKGFFNHSSSFFLSFFFGSELYKVFAMSSQRSAIFLIISFVGKSLKQFIKGTNKQTNNCPPSLWRHYIMIIIIIRDMKKVFTFKSMMGNVI